MRTTALKYVQDIFPAGRPEAYDLRVDAKERRNLCEGGTDACKVFAETIDAWQAEMKALADQMRRSPPPTAALDERARERLRALGYDH